jgi:hypothetical protein
MNSKLARLPRTLLIAAATAALATALAACSTSNNSTGTGGTGHTHTTAPKTKAKAASAPKSASALSGKWSGNYSGSYSGTFKLNWRQSGSHLHGTITISNPKSTLPINGTVNGTAIKFGTVGSTAITYTGTVSGNSMSGTYKVGPANGSTGGPWSASKS